MRGKLINVCTEQTYEVVEIFWRASHTHLRITIGSECSTYTRLDRLLLNFRTFHW